MKEQQQFYEKRLKNADKEIASFKEKFSRIEENIGISLKSNIPETKQLIDVFSGIIEALQITTKEQATKEIKNTLNKAEKMNIEELLDIVNIKDIANIHKKNQREINTKADYKNTSL